jgi:hypothetical protein
MKATSAKLFKYLNTTDACEVAKDFVHGFGKVPIAVVFDALRLQDEEWLRWMIVHLRHTKFSAEIGEAYIRLLDWYRSPEVRALVEYKMQQRALLTEQDQLESMSIEEYHRRYQAIFDDADRLFDGMWQTFKTSVRADVLNVLEKLL